eukprot:scaffold15799_cov28-Tisochrysis_lutea.AAC.2
MRDLGVDGKSEHTGDGASVRRPEHCLARDHRVDRDETQLVGIVSHRHHWRRAARGGRFLGAAGLRARRVEPQQGARRGCLFEARRLLEREAILH